MRCDDLPDDLRILWKEGGTDRPTFSLEQLRENTARLLARRRRGSAILGSCMAVFVATFALCFFCFHNNLTRIGSVLGVFGFGYWLVDLLEERARAVPDLGETDGVRFYRAELERVRDWHRGLRRRLLVIPVPSILFNLGFAQLYAKRFAFVAPLMWIEGAFMLAVFAIWAPVGHARLARKVQSRIDALDAAVRSGGQADPTE